MARIPDGVELLVTIAPELLMTDDPNECVRVFTVAAEVMHQRATQGQTARGERNKLTHEGE